MRHAGAVDALPAAARTLTLLAHKHDLFMVVQASGQLPPVENLWHYTVENGADLAVVFRRKGDTRRAAERYSGGRRALDRPDEHDGPAPSGIARTAKEGREEIISVYMALKKFLQPGQMEARLHTMSLMREKAAQALEESGHFKTTVLTRPGPGRPIAGWAWKCWARFRRREPKKSLLELDPGIVVGGMGGA